MNDPTYWWILFGVLAGIGVLALVELAFTIHYHRNRNRDKGETHEDD